MPHIAPSIGSDPSIDWTTGMLQRWVLAFGSIDRVRGRVCVCVGLRGAAGVDCGCVLAKTGVCNKRACNGFLRRSGRSALGLARRRQVVCDFGERSIDVDPVVDYTPRSSFRDLVISSGVID